MKADNASTLAHSKVKLKKQCKEKVVKKYSAIKL